jgi:cytochrome P450
MSDKPAADWDPRAGHVLADQMEGYDAMRRRCPVAYSDYLHWSLFHHEDVVHVLNDPQTFSSAVSAYLNVPNGMDPPEHAAYRRIIEPYFSSQRMQAFEPRCREIAAELVAGLPAQGEVELIGEFAQPFALRMQSAFLGWPAELHEPLRQWLRKNHEATLAGDRAAMTEVALEFDGYIKRLLAARRQAGKYAADDITSSLMREEVKGRALTDEEIVSILRNWTVGELGTMAASVGILVNYLANRPPLQQQLRERPADLPAAIDEILRIQAPLISNRRVTTRPVELGGRKLAAGERLTLIWASANRDEAVFGDPDEFRLDRDPAENLLWGAGVHVCPGAPLAKLELRVIMEELLAGTERIEPLPDRQAVNAVYPGSGFSELPLRIIRAGSHR